MRKAGTVRGWASGAATCWLPDDLTPGSADERVKCDKGLIAPIKIQSGRTNDQYDEGWTLHTDFRSVVCRTGALVQVFGIAAGLEEYVQARIAAAN